MLHDRLINGFYSRLVSEALFPLHEWVLKRPTFSYLEELDKSQWLHREAIEQLQMTKLRSLLSIASANCPWHARRIEEANISVGNHDHEISLEEFRRLPTMTKDDARQHRDEMVWRQVPGGLHRYNTGGSSGEPLVFFYGRWRQASDAAGRMRAHRWWGVDVGDREVYLWGAPVELDKTDRIKTLRDRLFNHLVLNAFEMSSETMGTYIDAIRNFRPKCIYGYASSVALLAAHARERGADMRMPQLKVACTTGEPLYDHQRALISEVFDVPVANEFGSRDIGFTAHETPEHQMLLMSESILLEVLDDRGQPVADGEVGEAVITGLCSDAQPFLRYRTGDMLRYSSEACRSGRGLHVVQNVEGRSTDFIVRADGTIMHALAVIYILREIDEVREFKFIQHSVRDVEVLILPTDAWTETARHQIEHGIQRRLGDDVRITIRLVDQIAAENSGKYRYVVSEVPLPVTEEALPS